MKKQFVKRNSLYDTVKAMLTLKLVFPLLQFTAEYLLLRVALLLHL